MWVIGDEIRHGGEWSVISAIYPTQIALYRISDRQLYYANREFIQALETSERPPKKIPSYMYQPDKEAKKIGKTRLLDVGHPVFFYDILDGAPVVHDATYVCGSHSRTILARKEEYITVSPRQVFCYEL